MVNLLPEQVNTIIKRYKDQRQSATMLAKEFKTNTRNILNILRDHNIEIRSSVLTKQKNNEIINRYIQGESTYKLAKAFGVSKGTILNLLKKNNIERRTSNSSSNVPIKDRDLVIKRYINGNTVTDIANDYGCYNIEILTIIKKAGVDVRPYIQMESDRGDFQELYTEFDENFFNVVDEEKKAYWLGFIASDGIIQKKELVIKTKKIDKDHLEKIIKELNTKKRVDKVKSRKILEKYEPTKINICSIHLCNDLRKQLGLSEKNRNKSHNTNFPKHIPSYLYKHFIRGLLDGDGCIQYNGRSDCKVSFWGAKNICETIREILVAECGASYINPRTKDPLNISDEFIYEIRWGGKIQVLKILDWLYEGASIYLERKYQQYQSIEIRDFTNILEVTSGKELRQRREELELSRGDLALKIGCSTSFINGMENEYRTSVNSKIAKRLFHALGY